MTPFFIEPPIDSVIYRRGESVKNNSVNLTLCKSIEKSRLYWYPDNFGLASIKFNGADQEWVFDDDKSRDETYSLIVNNKYQMSSE